MFERDIYKKVNGNLLRATMNLWRDKVYMHVREYQMDGDTGYWFPTKKGYTFDPEEIDSVIETLKEMSEVYAKYSRQETWDEKQLELNLEDEPNEH
jgi:hypothetical protein